MAASHKFSKTIEVKIETGDDEFENKYEDIMDTALKRGKKQSSSKINEAANVPDDASPRTKRKMQNRYYCQINRRKKKEYVVELEEKIESLEKEIVQLNKKINSLYTKINAMVIGDDKDLNELNEIQTFSRNMAVKELQEGHDLIRLQKRIRLLSSNTGGGSENRHKLIKSAFKVIIDNIVPGRIRVLLGMVDQDFKARQEDIGKLLFCITFHIVKLFKMNSKDFELESKNPIYTDLDRLHYRTKVDPYSHWNYIENYHSSYKHAKMGLQDSIHSLIKCRNKVLNAMLVFSETDNPKIFGFTPENIIKFYEATSILEQKEKYDIWNVWHIKKGEAKPKGTKIMKYNEDDVELTDFETMSEIIST